VTTVTTATLELERAEEQISLLLSKEPMTFEQYLQTFGEDDDYELIDGVPVERMSAQLDHERLYVWLLTLIHVIAEANRLGIVLGSRSAVRISNFRARLPDLLYVRAERMDIVRQLAIYGAPDMVMEIVSPNDRRSDVLQREADYRTLGVEEIWMIDRRRKVVRLLQRTDEDYAVQEVLSGVVESRVIPSLRLQVEWLFNDERPPVWEVLRDLGL
jgi:Uma2 family endonuclease